MDGKYVSTSVIPRKCVERTAISKRLAKILDITKEKGVPNSSRVIYGENSIKLKKAATTSYDTYTILVPNDQVCEINPKNSEGDKLISHASSPGTRKRLTQRNTMLNLLLVLA